MSVVYEVEHEFTGDRLALKVLKGNAANLDPVALVRFRREARVSALLRSDHIVRVFDADISPELGGAPFLVMDLLRGTDLATLAGREAQPPERVVEWLRQVARALDLVHGLGVVHRDLKAENLFLTESAEGHPLVKVLDFGVAKIPALEELDGTRTGSVVGTPRYMSPEQASGTEVGPSADIWSVGMCAFRLLSGRDYWIAPNVTLMLAKIVYERIVPPSESGLDLGAKFDAWFLRSCARDPANRWDSVGLQVEALAAAFGYPEVAIPFAAPSESPFLRARDEGNAGVGGSFRAHSLDGSATAALTQQFSKPGLLALAIAFAVALTTAALLFHRSSSPSRQPGREEAQPLTIPAVDKVAPQAVAVDAVPAKSIPSAPSSVGDPSPPSPTLRRDGIHGAARTVSRRGASSVTAPVSSVPSAPSVPSPDRSRDPLADPD